MTGATLGHLYGRAAAGGWLDRLAVVDESTGATTTHRELYSAAQSFSSHLTEAGVRDREHVGLCVGDRAEWIVAFLACTAIGAVPVLVNPDATPALLESQFDLCGVRRVLEWRDGRICLVDRDSPAAVVAERLSNLARGTTAIDLCDAADSRVIYRQFSSGTTGAPKSIGHRGTDLEHYFQAVAGPDRLGISRTDVIVSVSQFYFAYGFNNQFVYPMFSGCAVVVRAARRRPAELRATLRRYPGTTLLFAVPSALAGFTGDTRGRAPALRGVVSAGEALPASVETRVRAEWGVPVLEQIGCTEVGNAFCANGFESYAARSAGPVCDGYRVEVRPSATPEVAALAARSAPGIGDIWVAGPTIAPTVSTADGPVELLTDGWLPTNDYGYWNGDGGLVVLGRRDDILLVGGICVSAVHVEAEIMASTDVRDVAVTAVVDTSGKSGLCAFVVPAEPGGATADEVVRNLAGRVERHEVPKTVVLVTEIPRTPSGKIRRHELARAATELEYEGVS